ncbi:hypothetical protein P872_09345 [Rhodonellum psychrophilum GCM71 = DSM 17998]|uniref:Uncharacterized protein n=1 Tax=Rhodonellum psychrophilum GCM71 = DSM 17998 TaxID=1123057 RepID=U5BV48_9BACT|nr:hypothetical protein P872_09345 [Rhodonellum psychrophilum GCM71 = DSM 17998]
MKFFLFGHRVFKIIPCTDCKNSPQAAYYFPEKNFMGLYGFIKIQVLINKL